MDEMRIVVGFLRSREGQAALDRAIEEAQLRGGDLLVVHSLQDEPKEALAYEDELKKVEARLTDLGIGYEVKKFVRGNTPAEDVLQAAEDEGAELIVIGIRRRSPVGKLVMGSNAQTILLNAGCAVLAVKPADD